MADSSIDTDITEAITNGNLDNLLAQAITNNSHLTIPHLVSLGGSAHSDPVLTALLAPGTFPSLMTLITKCNYDVNTNLDRMGSFLILSIKHDNAEEVRTLLSYGANPNLGLYAHLYSPLASAVEYGASLDIVDMLLRAGAIVQKSDALHVAAGKGRVDVLHRLLDSGADINEIGFEYAAVERFADMAGSALHFAVDGGRKEVVRLLLESGVDRQLRDAQGMTALERAKEKGHEGCITLLDS
ncbi:MAG: hypothetical protein Q9190_007141 [Brigantiaea leucoxantha]